MLMELLYAPSDDGAVCVLSDAGCAVVPYTRAAVYSQC